MKLTNGTVTIRPYEETDLDQLVTIANNPEVSRWLSYVFPSPYTRECGESWIKKCQDDLNPKAFAITDNGVLVGGIGIEIFDDVVERTGELGYWLGEPFWRKGIGSTAVELFVKWCFETFDLERIEAACFEQNIGSAKVMEKAGFTFEGVLRNRIFKFGKPANAKMYSILKHEIL